MAALAEKAMVAEWSSGKCNCGLRVHVPSLRHGGKPSDRPHVGEGRLDQNGLLLLPSEWHWFVLLGEGPPKRT